MTKSDEEVLEELFVAVQYSTSLEELITNLSDESFEALIDALHGNS